MSPKATLTASVIGLGPKVFQPLAGVYDRSDQHEREQLESIMRQQCRLPSREICKGIAGVCSGKDERIYEEHRIDDKTVFVIKRTRVAEQQAAVSLFP